MSTIETAKINIADAVKEAKIKAQEASANGECEMYIFQITSDLASILDDETVIRVCENDPRSPAVTSARDGEDFDTNRRMFAARKLING